MGKLGWFVLKFLWFSLVASFSSVLFSASFFLLLLSIFLLLPEEDLVSKALVCLYHRSSSIGEFSFLVLFLTCLPHQQLLAFSSVLKDSEASLFVDDFALCIRAKSLLHAKRLMQLCVIVCRTGSLTMVLNSPTAKQSACTFVISVNTLQNRLSSWKKSYQGSNFLV